MARGVRKVYEDILLDGRAIIVTDKNKDNYDWADIPDGSKFIDTETGFEYVKLEGQSDWVPSYIKNDNTISIAKDAIIETETFFVKEILETELICETETGDIRHFMKDEDEFFVIEIENGTYPMGRDYLSVFINDIFLRTQENKGILEITPSRFKLLEEPALNMKITAKYYRTIRIGNPYPRVFINEEDPGLENAEEGDIWVDTNAHIDPEGNINVEDYGGKIPWSMIAGTPTSLQGYHINDKVSLQGHKHTTKDISNFPSSMPANGGNAETAERLSYARKINGISFDGSENINIPVGVMSVNGITPNDDKNPGNVIIASLPIGYEFFSMSPYNKPFLENALPLIGGTHKRNTYIDLWNWVQTQTGYCISDEKWLELSEANNGNVPYYSYGDGSTTFRVPSVKCWVKGTDGNTDKIGKYLPDGLPNITGTFTGNTNDGSTYFSGALYIKDSSTKTGADGQSGAGIIGFDASKSNTIYGKSKYVQPKTIVGRWYVWAFGAITNVGNQDLAEISSSFTYLETKINSMPFTARATTIGKASITKPAVVVKTYRKNTSWYRVWSDGWIEQGGYCTGSGYAERTVSLYEAFSDTNYAVFVTGSNGSETSSGTNYWYNKTTTTVGVASHADCHWYACGY